MVSLKDIEILTHCDVNRLNRAYLMAKTMPDDLAVTLIIGYKNPKDKEYSLANKPANISVYFEYYDPDTIYPTNRFRNIAFEKSTRDYIFYLDVDFIFQHDFWKNFQEFYLDKNW
jgi:predicted glycosyltransferase involved in capsule biosynthesis